jgi:hypothetical protein
LIFFYIKYGLPGVSRCHVRSFIKMASRKNIKYGLPVVSRCHVRSFIKMASRKNIKYGLPVVYSFAIWIGQL